MNPSAPASSPATAAASDAAAPWWRFPMVWLVVAGPLVVVIAGIATAVIAVRGADIVITDAPPVEAAQSGAANAPATQARNHAATARR